MGYDVADQYAADAIAELIDRHLTDNGVEGGGDIDHLSMDIVQMLRNDGWQQPTSRGFAPVVMGKTWGQTITTKNKGEQE